MSIVLAIWLVGAFVWAFIAGRSLDLEMVRGGEHDAVRIVVSSIGWPFLMIAILGYVLEGKK